MGLQPPDLKIGHRVHPYVWVILCPPYLHNHNAALQPNGPQFAMEYLHLTFSGTSGRRSNALPSKIFEEST